jgi:hypothetical protein
MKTTFIVTCAVNTNIGIYDPSFRILQIHQTIDSILKHYADANILLVDGGKPITDNLAQQYNGLRQRAHAFLDMTNNEQVQKFHEDYLDKIPVRHEMGGTTGLVKSAAENIIMYNILYALQNSADLEAFKNVDRIFKISGRYILSPMFNTSEYTSTPAMNRYVFKQRDTSWMTDAETAIGVKYSYSSRLWSFPADWLGDCIDRYETIINDYYKIAETHYVDIEHLLFKHIGPIVSHEIEHTHLMGTIAPNGTLIYD